MPKKPNKVNPEIKKEANKAAVYITKLFSLRLTKLIVGGIILLLIFPFVLFYFIRPKTAENINYGVTFSNKYAKEIGLDWQVTFIKALDDLQVRNMRLVAYWDDIEKTPGIYDYSDIKWQLEESRKRNVNIILTIGRKVPRYPECFEPEWWKKIEEEKKRDDYLLAYIGHTVEELRGYDNVKIWQVENEPFFPFGTCFPVRKETLQREVALVKSLDNRPILIQDSGEGGFWFPTYQIADYLGISMYRKIWYDFWGVFLGKFIYFQYPLAHWSYKIKADIVRVPVDRIFVTELQAEPWGPALSTLLPDYEKNKTMSRADFLSTISYAQKSGFTNLYFWGVEWWLWEKEVNNNPFYWDTAKALFN